MQPDHKKLGRELDLFTFSDLVGAGLPLWTPKGALLRDLLDSFVFELRQKRGYERVDIPHLAKKELYIMSGHWDKFKDELFQIKTRENHHFVLKPMNCPHHIQIYLRQQWSYRELPQRYASTTKVYRDEQTGELNGLARVRAITQDDAHVFCRATQTKEEFIKIWDIVHDFYGAFGFRLRPQLSLCDPKTPDKYLGELTQWEEMEKMLREIISEKGVPAVEKIGEAAFYGPKLDFMADDSLGREWQVATIQLDMNMPENFALSCINEKGKKERVVMIHAAIMGSLERFLGLLIEHYVGAFPLWLAPVQVAVLTLGEKHRGFAEKINAALKAAGIRAELDASDNVLSKKIKEHKLNKIPYLVIIGDQEMKDNKLTIETRAGKMEGVSVEQFLKHLDEEIKNKT